MIKNYTIEIETERLTDKTKIEDNQRRYDKWLIGSSRQGGKVKENEQQRGHGTVKVMKIMQNEWMAIQNKIDWTPPRPPHTQSRDTNEKEEFATENVKQIDFN